uniref:Zinc-ribbon domain-containing protein n=1 Tax=Thermofilum adornatum TaxID=1365176 RepID=A0A7C1CFG8_9CREN
MDIDKELIKAVKSRDIKKVKELLEKGANPNAKDGDEKTPLHYAAEKGSVDIAKLLINKGANVNAKSCDGFTPLHVAAMKGNLPVVELLLESGADPNAIDKYGKTPAELAHKEGYTGVAELIKEYVEGKRKRKVGIELVEFSSGALRAGVWGSLVLKLRGSGVFSLELEGDVDYFAEDAYSLSGEGSVEVAVRPRASGRLPVKLTVRSGESRATKLIWLSVEEGKITCPHCGAKVEPGSKYCWKCGAKIEPGL